MNPIKTKPRGKLAKKRRPNGAPGRRDSRGWLDPRKRHDAGPKQQSRPMCNCGAYMWPRHPGERARPRKRPHLYFAGKCKPDRWVESFFDPYKDECRNCMNLDEQSMECQVVEGIETVFQCPELRDYIRYEGIVLYGRVKSAMERAQGKRR